MMGGPGPLIQVRAGFGPDGERSRHPVTPGTARRVLPYLGPYRWRMSALLLLTAVDAFVVIAVPLLFKVLIDDGIMPEDTDVVVMVSLTVAGLSAVQALVGVLEARSSAKVSEGLVYDLRRAVFEHVQRQPLAFFTRAQTGSLVSRLNTDVVAAQQATSSLLATVMSGTLVLAMVLVTICYLSWVVGLIALLVLPFFVLPGRVIGRRLQRLLRESMQNDAELGTLLHERFNVSGALLTKLYGRPEEETRLFARRASRVRDLGVTTAVYSRALLITVTLLASLATALVYGLGGGLVIGGSFQIGTLVALAALLTRLFGPINQLSNVQAQTMTALVSFDRLFEVLDLRPGITERTDAVAVPATGGGTAPELRFEAVSFRYPAAAEVSLASLESATTRAPERADDSWVLREVSFTAPAGRLTALVGPSGAGKTTITQLVPRLYDPDAGTVRIGDRDLKELRLDSLRDTVGMVTQDAHLFHDTLRANLEYARPGVAEREIVEACQAAQIWDQIASLPNGLDTLVGERGHRFSGGEKQRLAIARLLLKAPSIVVLDEATAHLDSESEAAVQRALRTALAGRTSLVIAHRLSTVRDADQILVVDQGRLVERGHHDELMALDGVYAELYRTQFARPPARRPEPGTPADAAAANGVGQPAGPPPGGGVPHLLPPPNGGGGTPHLLPPPGERDRYGPPPAR